MSVEMLGRANPASFAWDDIDHPILMLASEFNTLAILVVLDGKGALFSGIEIDAQVHQRPLHAAVGPRIERLERGGNRPVALIADRQ